MKVYAEQFQVILLLIPFLYDIVYLILNSPVVKKGCSPKKAIVKKKSEIQGGGQEMAVMVGQWQIF